MHKSAVIYIVGKQLVSGWFLYKESKKYTHNVDAMNCTKAIVIGIIE